MSTKENRTTLGGAKKLTLLDATAQSVGLMGPVFSIAFLVPLVVGLGTASGTGAMLYELNGTFAWMPGGCLTAPIAFLPLLLYGIERSRRAGSRGLGLLLVGIGICGGISYRCTGHEAHA